MALRHAVAGRRAAHPARFPESGTAALSSSPGGFWKLLAAQDTVPMVRPLHGHGGGLRRVRASEKTRCPVNGESLETQNVGPLCPLPVRAAWSVTYGLGLLPSPDPPVRFADGNRSRSGTEGRPKPSPSGNTAMLAGAGGRAQHPRSGSAGRILDVVRWGGLSCGHSRGAALRH